MNYVLLEMWPIYFHPVSLSTNEVFSSETEHYSDAYIANFPFGYPIPSDSLFPSSVIMSTVSCSEEAEIVDTFE